MSQISLKSISGITSITTPAGADNQFTIHTNNTSEVIKLDHAGNIHINNHVNATGISSAASIDVGSNIKLGNAGIITATCISGGTFSGSTATFSGDVSITDKIVHTDDTNTAIRFPAVDTVTVETNNTERFRIGSNGYIGVGNFSSKSRTDPLNVDSGIGTCNIGGNYIHLSRYSGGGTNYITAPQNNANLHISADDYIAIGVDHSSSIYSHNTEAIRIDSTGDIGLGESNPNRTGYSSPVVSIGYNNGNGYSVLELLGNKTSNSTIANIVAYNVGGSSRLAAIGFERSDANNSGAIRFETYTSGSSAERMRISKEGYVTKPSSPSFCARFQSGDSYVSTDIFRLTLINNDFHTWNIGGHYSTSTGKFTCPVAGVYYFEGQAMTTGHSNGGAMQDMMELRTNNGLVTYCRQRRSYFRSDADANGYYVNSTGSQVKLAVGDTVWFQRRSGLSYGFGNVHYTYFTGWLIG